MTLSPGLEPGPHWWEASALTAVPSLLPQLLPYPIIIINALLLSLIQVRH